MTIPDEVAVLVHERIEKLERILNSYKVSFDESVKRAKRQNAQIEIMAAEVGRLRGFLLTGDSSTLL